MDRRTVIGSRDSMKQESEKFIQEPTGDIAVAALHMDDAR